MALNGRRGRRLSRQILGVMRTRLLQARAAASEPKAVDTDQTAQRFVAEDQDASVGKRIPTYAVITVALAGLAIAAYFAYGPLVLLTASVAEGD